VSVDWDEHLHRRDRRGRFAERGGVTVITLDEQGVPRSHPPTADIPDDPLAALTDINNPFNATAALDVLVTKHGSAQDRERLAQSLTDFRRIARNPEGPIRGQSADDFGYMLRTRMRNNPREFASMIIGWIDEQPPEDQHLYATHRVAVAYHLDEFEREKFAAGTVVGARGGPYFTDKKQAREWANDYMPNPALSAEHVAAVRGYTGDFDAGLSSTKINKLLRNIELPEDVMVALKQAALIDEAIDASRLRHPLLLMRGEEAGGLRSLGIDPDDDDSLATLVGDTVSDKGFLSTSIGRQPGGAGIAGGDITWIIRAPEGSPGLFTREHLTQWPTENEVLLPRNAQRYIHAVYRDPNYSGRIFIEAELVSEGADTADWTPNPYGDAWREYMR
jgi:hypothetical protein